MESTLPRNLKNWETTRILGKSRYVVRYGIIGWGIPVGVVVTLLNIWQRGFSAFSIIIAGIIWPIAGYFFGVITWAISERRYQRFYEGGKTKA
jgi:hypothetical protein